MSEEFIPREVVKDSFQYWWLLVIFMLAGAAGGWLFHRVRPPVYEARSLLSVTVDLTQTGKLTELEHDRALEIVGDVISSSKVIRTVVNEAQHEGIEIDEQSFKQIAFRERKSQAYLFRVRHENPLIASRLVNLWTSTAYDVLNQALVHAIAADQLQNSADALSSCLKAVVSEPVHAYCNIENLENIQQQMLDTGKKVFEERKQSMGIFSGLSFVWTEEAFPPESPRLYGKNLMMLSGAFIGLIVAIWLVALRVPARIFRK